MNIGKAMNIMLVEKNLTQLELGKRIGYTQTFISLVINNKREPSKKFLEAFCNEIQISLDEFMFLALEKDNIKKDRIITLIINLLKEFQ